MNFLSFRDQLYDWTLDTDQSLFNQVNELTNYIFQTQKSINQSVVITKANLNQNSTILNNNFNHYLRLSENKFTQNKIAQSKKLLQQTAPKQQQVVEAKTKMEIYKEALNISLKNLQIKEEDKQPDNVSVSEMSLSQAIFKNARLPPYFGSKQFRAQKFLNLFFDQDLQESIIFKKQFDNLSNEPLSTPSQNIAGNYSNLAPPPSLDSLNLGLNNYSSEGPNSVLPPPPPLGLSLPPPPPLGLSLSPLGLSLPPPPPLGLSLPPPPPLSQNLISPSISSNFSAASNLSDIKDLGTPQIKNKLIDEKDENKDLLQSILEATRGTEQRSGFDSFPQNEHQQLKQKDQYSQSRAMTFQQELALKLKLGKGYKPAIRLQINTAQSSSKQKLIVQSQSQQTQNYQRANSFRQSTKIEQIIGNVGSISASNPTKSTKKQPANNISLDQQEEQQNSIFGSSKRKTISPASNLQSQNSKFGLNKNQTDLIMSRSTFNEDMLFKKKSAFSNQNIIKKTQEKTQQKVQKKPNRASVLFNQDSDQQDDFTFKKKVKPSKQQQKKSQPQQLKKQHKDQSSNPLIQSETIVKKVQQPKKQQKKKTVNKLFGGDSDQQEDTFAKKKPLNKKNSQGSQKNSQSPVKIIQKAVDKKIQKIEQKTSPKQTVATSKNPIKKSSLFNEDEDEDFTFKPKAKPTKKQSKNIKEEQQQQQFLKPKQKKESLVRQTVKSQQPHKQIKQEHAQKQQPQKKQSNEKQTIKMPLVNNSKQKKPLFSTIHQQQDQNQSVVSVKRQIRLIKQQDKLNDDTKNHKSIQNQVESEQTRIMNKITRMGGQAMMGMTQFITKGKIATKVSQDQKAQKLDQYDQYKIDQKIIQGFKQQQVNEIQKIQQFQKGEQRNQQVQKSVYRQENIATEIANSQQKNKIQQKSERKLDPLQLIIKNLVIDKRITQTEPRAQKTQLHTGSQNKQLSPIQQSNPQIEQSKYPIQQTNLQSQVGGLSVRRKKNKSKKTSQDIFDQQQNQKLNEKSISNKLQIVSQPQEKNRSFGSGIKTQNTSQKVQITQQNILQNQSKKEHGIEQSKPLNKPNQLQKPATKVNPLMPPLKAASQKQSQIQKISRMGMAGMSTPGMMMPGMGMGFGPLLPKGMIITKPSEAKKMEQQALQKLKYQEQQRKAKQQLEQLQKKQLLKVQNQQLKEKILEKKQEEQKRELFEQKLKEQQQLQQSILKQQQQRLRKKNIQQQSQRQRERKMEEQRVRIMQQQGQITRKKHQKEFAEQQVQKNKIQESQKLQAERQRRQQEQIQKMQIEKQHRIQPERLLKSNLPTLPILEAGLKKENTQLITKSKSPLGDVPKLPPKANPLGGPSKGLLSGPLSGPLSGSLSGVTKKALLPSVPVLASINKQPPKKTGKRTLFDDDDQDEGFSKKKQIIPPQKVNINQKKKASLFDDDDEDFGFGKKAKPKKNKETTKRGLFGDDDDQQFGFGKKTAIKQQPKQQAQSQALQADKIIENKTQNHTQAITQSQPKISVQKYSEIPVEKYQDEVKAKYPSSQGKVIIKQKNKNNLFGDSDSEEDNGFIKKKLQHKVFQKVAIVATNNFVQKPIKSQPQKKEGKSKKGLFDDDDENDENDTFTKQAIKKTQIAKKISPAIINQSLPESQKTETTKTGQSPLSNSLDTGKVINPFGKNSSGPSKLNLGVEKNSSQSKKSLQPQRKPVQKKRNIFQQSQQQSESSPIISPPNKLKITPHQNKPALQQKKALISEDSDGQAQKQKMQVVKQQAKIKPIPIQEQQQIKATVKQAQKTSNSNNRKLFDDSQDSDDEELRRKQRQATSKFKKLF